MDGRQDSRLEVIELPHGSSWLLPRYWLIFLTSFTGSILVAFACATQLTQFSVRELLAVSPSFSHSQLLYIPHVPKIRAHGVYTNINFI